MDFVVFNFRRFTMTCEIAEKEKNFLTSKRRRGETDTNPLPLALWLYGKRVSFIFAYSGVYLNIFA